MEGEHHPLVSVIIPTLNEEKLIIQTLGQFSQDLRKKFGIEVIISDGGSSDRTLSLVSSHADAVVTPEPGVKQNISIGRNAGAKKASGKYLYFFNADTLIGGPENFFMTTLKTFGQCKAAALTCSVKVFPSEVRLSDRIFHNCYNNYVFILNKLGIGMGRGECHMVRADIFSRSGGYNESMAAGEDFDLYRRIRKIGRIKFLRDLTVYESPRRYRKSGYISVLLDWTKNSLSVLFRNRAVSKQWKPVR